MGGGWSDKMKSILISTLVEVEAWQKFCKNESFLIALYNWLVLIVIEPWD